jgi:hypothetical protein
MNDGAGVFTEGDPAHRQAWVWGHGAQICAGSAAEPPSEALAASSDEVVAPAFIAAALEPQASLNSPVSARTTSTRVRGAAYIRPPPSLL